MAIACNPSCGTVNITTWTESCDLRSMLLKGGIRQLIFMDCDVTMTDVTSSTEWTTLKTATKFQLSPKGNAVFAASAKEEIELDCDRMVVTKITKPIEFMSKLLDPTAAKHHDFVNDINESGLNKVLLFVDCNDRLYYRYNWTTATSPGFALNKAFADIIEENKYQSLKVDFELNLSTDNYQSMPLTAALKTAIGL